MNTRALLCGLLFGCATFGGFADDIKPESGRGKKFVGEQLKAFKQDPDGAFVATKDAWINLYYTESAPFRLSGKVWLGGPSKTLDHPWDLPDGFALFLREWDSLHRYSLTSRSLIVKRRLNEGVKEPKIANVAKLESPAMGEWVPFTVEATPAQIVFRFGKHSGVIKGPLDMDGANKIALAPGTKIKDIQLEILEADAKPVSSQRTASATTSASAREEINSAPASRAPLAAKTESGGMALTFHTLPGKRYQLKFKNDLSDLNWTPLGPPVTASGAATVIQDDTSAAKRFYTVVQEP